MKQVHYFSILCLSVLVFSSCSKSNSSSSAGKTAVVTTFAGSGAAGYADGNGTAAQFNHPFGVTIDAAGNVYVSDETNEVLRKITAAGTVTTLAGSALSPGHADGSGTAAQFFNPDGIVVDAAGNVFVGDLLNNRIRKVSAAGAVTTVAGNTGGYTDGTAGAAQFFYPTGTALDAAGNLYVADTYNHRIRKITPGGVVSTIAGSGATGAGNGGYADGAASSAMFQVPSGVALDAAGNIYVADYGNYKIRKINTSGVVSTVAGSVDGEQDGTGSAAEFGGPSGIAVDGSGNLYVCDQLGTVRKITSAGVVTTIAGGSGTATAGVFGRLTGIALDAAGNIYVADYGNNVIKKITFQ